VKPAQSTLGIRANWTCAKCPTIAITYQVARIEPANGIGGAAVVLDPPAGWETRAGIAICPAHNRTRRRA
jgi:hypothetical protein